MNSKDQRYLKSLSQAMSKKGVAKKGAFKKNWVELLGSPPLFKRVKKSQQSVDALAFYSRARKMGKIK
ncbi:MAG: hypothetical protein ACD_73C00318G0001 [uncultured bacterium]|nr:MAG: hypothetical protein ACD_73C00318G0001 [uncultured bacterium]